MRLPRSASFYALSNFSNIPVTTLFCASEKYYCYIDHLPTSRYTIPKNKRT